MSLLPLSGIKREWYVCMYVSCREDLPPVEYADGPTVSALVKQSRKLSKVWSITCDQKFIILGSSAF
jgi:hypothetical protein